MRVKVRDTGIGVEKAAQARIFESFVQANPDISREYGGSGLGLTADASAECRENCARAGMAACLTKPIDPEALLAAVAHAVQRPEPPRLADAAPAALAKKTAGTTDGALDPVALKALAALGGEDFLRALILEFVNEGAQIVERMIAAVGAGDQAAFQHEAHALSSSAGNLGAFELARLCGSWNDLAPDEIARHGDDYLEDLRREWSLAALALGKILARSAAAPSRKAGRRRREVA